MRYFISVVVILWCLACQSKIAKKPNVPGIPDGVDLANVSNLFPFDQNIEAMIRDSFNEFGAGDCWGNIQSLSTDQISITVDTTNCGEYGFYLNFYLFENSILRIAHQIEGDYLTMDDEQIIEENIYDFRKGSSMHLQRIDTGFYSLSDYDFHKPFVHLRLEDYQTTYEHLLINVADPWGMSIDY